MPKPTLNRASLHHQVTDHLRGRIYAGEWRPGECLPNEFELGKEYGVSNGTMRKALDALEAERLVKRIQGRGTRITSPTPWPDLSESLPAKRLLQLLGNAELIAGGRVRVRHSDGNGFTIYDAKDFEAMAEAAAEIAACLRRMPSPVDADKQADVRPNGHTNGAAANGKEAHP